MAVESDREHRATSGDELTDADELGDRGLMVLPGHESTFEALARAVWNGRARLPVMTLYGPGTTDLPGRYVMRLFWSLPDANATKLYLTAETLDQLRQKVPFGMTCLGRQDDDDRNIIESWL